jgi:heme A synthase
MFISVLTAWWWFGSGYYPKAMPAGRFLVLNILHALIGAATVTCGLAAIIAKIIELDKKKK